MKLTEEQLFESIVLSLTRKVEDFRLANMPSSQYVNWDNHANINELPESDVCGLAGVGMAEDDDDIYSIVFGVAMSTWGDTGGHRLTKLISKMRAQFTKGTRLTVYDPDAMTAVPKTWMITVLPLAVTPVQKAEVRAVQSVMVHALLDPSSTSSAL